MAEKRERTWTAQVIKDNHGHTKCAVPLPWVDNIRNIVYWPPKGQKNFLKHLTKWSTPEQDWQTFERVEELLSGGTKEEAEQMTAFETTTEEEEENSVKFKVTPLQRIESPVLKKNLKRKIRIDDSDEEELFGSSSPKRKSNIENTLPGASSCSLVSPFSGSTTISCTPPAVTPTIQQTRPAKNSATPVDLRYGDGGKGFTEMSNKQFQYVMLTELAKVKEEQKRILTEIKALKEVSLESTSSFDKTQFNWEPAKTMAEFEELEDQLQSKEIRAEKKNQIKRLGGKDGRSSVRLALDIMLTRDVQTKFSKDGLKGKRPFSKTSHYKCLIGALMEKYTKQELDYFIGDLLKRAGRKPARFTLPNTEE